MRSSEGSGTVEDAYLSRMPCRPYPQILISIPLPTPPTVAHYDPPILIYQRVSFLSQCHGILTG